jgi:hypothetical protein
VRALLTVVVLLVTAFGVGAAAPARSARFAGSVRVPATGADEFLLGDDFVAVNSGRDQRVYGYGLDGSLRWAAGLPIPRASLVAITGGIVLLTTPMWPGQTAALDRRTGAPLWTVDGLVQAMLGDTVVVGSGPSGPDGDGAELIALDARTGGERWRTTAGPTIPRRTMAVYDQDYLVVGRVSVERDGTGEVLDFRTGRRRPLHEVPDPPSAPDRVQVDTTDRFVLITRSQAAMSVGDTLIIFPLAPPPNQSLSADIGYGPIIGYGPDSPAPRWALPGSGGSPAGGCGPWICVVETDTTRVVDPATGAVLRTVGWPHVISGTAERLLGYDDAGAGDTTEIAVSDAGSGRILATYRGWRLLNRRSADWVAMVRRRIGLTWQLAALNLHSGVAYPLGTFENAGVRACRSTATHVACGIRSGDVLVWRLRPVDA